MIDMLQKLYRLVAFLPCYRTHFFVPIAATPEFVAMACTIDVEVILSVAVLIKRYGVAQVEVNT